MIDIKKLYRDIKSIKKLNSDIKSIKKLNSDIKRMDGNFFICKTCGKEYPLPEWFIGRTYIAKYCSTKCYFEDKRREDFTLKNFNSPEWELVRQLTPRVNNQKNTNDER